MTYWCERLCITEHLVLRGGDERPLSVPGGFVPTHRCERPICPEYIAWEPIQGVEVGKVHPAEVVNHPDVLMGVPYEVKKCSAGV